MPKPWKEVATSPGYLALSPEQREQARAQYFEQNVAPQVPPAELEQARAQFDAATQFRPRQRSVRDLEQAAQMHDATDGMSGLQKFAAGAGKSLVDTGRGIGDLIDLGRDALDGGNRDAQNRIEQDAIADRDGALMGSGAGLAGNITGGIAQVLSPGIVLKGAAALPAAARAAPVLKVATRAALPTRLLGNVAQGAALGGLQPVGTEDSRGMNMLLGGLAGGAGYVAAPVIGGLVRGAARVLQPLTRAGQETIVARALRGAATNPALLGTASPSAIPGVVRTLAEETGDAGIGQLQRQFSTQLADQASANNVARVEAIRDTFGARPGVAEAFENQAAQIAKETRRGLRGVVNPEPIDPTVAAELGRLGIPVNEPPLAIDLAPVNGLLAKMIDKATGRAGVQAPLEYVRKLLETPVRNASEAWNIRQTIDDLMHGKLGSDAPAARAARAELTVAKTFLDRQMRQAFPEWGTFLQRYKGLRTKADQARVGEELLERARAAADPTTGVRAITPATLAKAANDPDALVRAGTGFDKARADRALTQPQRQLLADLGDDANRMDAAATRGRAQGSDTAQNLATRNVLESAVGTRLASLEPVRRVATAGEKVYGLLGIPQRLEAVLVQALENPAEARRILERLPPADRKLLEQQLARPASLLAGAAQRVTPDRRRRPAIEVDVIGGTALPRSQIEAELGR